jgi:hypothetical protein
MCRNHYFHGDNCANEQFHINEPVWRLVLKMGIISPIIKRNVKFCDPKVFPPLLMFRGDKGNVLSVNGPESFIIKSFGSVFLTEWSSSF